MQQCLMKGAAPPTLHGPTKQACQPRPASLSGSEMPPIGLTSPKEAGRERESEPYCILGLLGVPCYCLWPKRCLLAHRFKSVSSTISMPATGLTCPNVPSPRMRGCPSSPSS